MSNKQPPVAQVIDVTDFGVEPDTGKDAVEGVRKALRECRELSGGTLFFPEGRYDFWPEDCEEITYYLSNTEDDSPKLCPVVLKDIQDLTIRGNGSEFICHGRMQPLTLEGCSNIKVQDIYIDWKIPLVAQATITDVQPEYIDIKIKKKETPFDIRDGKIEFYGENWRSPWQRCHEFEAATRLIPQLSADKCLGEGWKNYVAEEIDSDGRVRLHCDFARKPKVGNILIMRHSKRGPAGVFIYHSTNTAFQNVNLYNTAGLGFLGQFSENITLNNCSVMPNYTRGRYQSGYADGFQASNCRGQIVVDACKFEGLMDDPINVHGTSVVIEKIESKNKLLCAFKHPSSKGLGWGRCGDNIGLLDRKTMATVATNKIKTFSNIDVDKFAIELTGDIPDGIREGDALENLTWTPNFTVRNTWFGSCRARSLVVSTRGKVVVEYNDFISSGAAIVITGDASNWYESGAVRDVLIRGNRFHPHCMTNKHGAGEGVISISPVIPDPDSDHPFHRNIRIINNVFDVFDYSVLFAFSVEGLKFNNNTIKHNTQYEPWLGRKAMLTFIACKAVEVKDNLIDPNVFGKNVNIRDMDLAQIDIETEQDIELEQNNLANQA